MVENATSNNLHELFKELQCMLEVGHHPNIINLIGYALDSSNIICLVLTCLFIRNKYPVIAKIFII